MAQDKTSGRSAAVGYIGGAAAAAVLVFFGIYLAMPSRQPVTADATAAATTDATAAATTDAAAAATTDAAAAATTAESQTLTSTEPVTSPQSNTEPAPTVAAPKGQIEEGKVDPVAVEPESGSVPADLKNTATSSENTEPTNDALPPLQAPSFDIVRVAPDGAAVVAGKAEPGSVVSVVVDGQELGTTTAESSDGEFALFLTIEPSGRAQVLTLEARLDQRFAVSNDQIILAPSASVAGETPQGTEIADADVSPEAPSVSETVSTGSAGFSVALDNSIDQLGSFEEPTTGLADTRAARPVASVAQADADQAIQGTSAPDVEIAAVDTGIDGSETLAPVAQAADDAAQPDTTVATSPLAVLRSGPEGLEVLQPVNEETGGDALALDAIGYSAEGDVQLTGRGGAGNLVRLYLNNRTIGDASVEGSGRWVANFDGIEPGIYTLRLDELGGDGAVLSRIETPFKREAPEVLQQPRGASVTAASPPVEVITVQEGDTLWAISRERYGDGLLFVKVFEANQADIRDPDLIYPGQVFALPE